MSDTTPDPHDSAEFSVAEARAIVRDLFEARPAIYWADFLTSLAVGYLGLGLLLEWFDCGRWQGAGVALGLLLATCAFYRAVLFTHELVHLKGAAFTSFRVAWNLLCGIPLMVPSFTYYTHVEHHAKRTYGTKHDAEYLPLGTQTPWMIVLYFMQPWVVPAALYLRFQLLAPLGWLFPAVRQWAHRHASSLVMNPDYLRPLPTDDDLRIWRWQELGCFAVTTTVTTLIVTGIITPLVIERYYAMTVGMVVLNHLRTAGAHRFVYRGNRELTFLEQLLDSLNYPHAPLLTGIWAPVGLRYHALHHLFPALPYHALHTAHERLMAQLPADSPYRQTVSPGLLQSLRQLWANAYRNSGQRNRPPTSNSSSSPRNDPTTTATA